MTFLKTKANPLLRVDALLYQSIGGEEPARPVTELHASDLTKQDLPFCPREVVLMRKLGVNRPPQYIPQALRVTFDTGHAVQWRLNNVYLRQWMMGDWRCLHCHEIAKWCRAPDLSNEDYGQCVRKAGHTWEYREPVFHHPSGFTGTLDGVVRFSPTKMRIVEFKIVKGEPSASSSAPNFKEIIAPLAEHRVRTQLYLRMVAEAKDKRIGLLDTSAAHVVYVSRGHGVKGREGRISPFKEYVVTRDDAKVERYVRMAHAVANGMPEGICGSALCPRAKKCSVVKQCFSGKFPANNNWSDGL